MKKLPLSLSGLMLGLTASANFLGQYITVLRFILLLPAILIGLAVLVKCLRYPKLVTHELSAILPLSSLPTFSMALSLMSVDFPNPLGHLIWYAALCSHVFLLLLFTFRVVRNGRNHQIIPYSSWFIVYVGLAALSITARVFKEFFLGQAIFLFTCLTYLILMFFLLRQIPLLKTIPKENLPNLAIMSAPSSLLLLAYLSLYAHPQFFLVFLLLFLSQFFYFITVIYLLKKIRGPFSPAFVAFTFPSVSTATALKSSLLFLSLHSFASQLLLSAEILFAIFLLVYVAWGESKFLLKLWTAK